MADTHRPSERTARNSESSGRAGNEHLGNALDEVNASIGAYTRGIVERGQSIVQGTQENTHELLEGARRIPGQINQWGLDRERDMGDAAVRARRDLRIAGQQWNDGMDARERQLYPQDQTIHPTAARVPHPTQRHDAAPAQRHDAAPTQRHDATPAARHADTTPPRANHDYVVQRGDNISSIVHRNEERLHPGAAHDMRREAVISQGLVNRHGERILPGMHLDLG